MFKAKGTFWLVQIGGWLLFSSFVFFATLFAEPKTDRNSLLLMASMFFAAGVMISLVVRFVYIKLGWLDVKFGSVIFKIIGVSVLASTALSLVNNIVGMILERSIKKITITEFILDVTATFILFVMWNGIYFSVHYFEKSNRQELNNIMLSASNNEIELKNLRAQLNPHFLFNSLNSIRALIDLEPYTAKENITKLSNLLRKSLVMGGNQLVTLDEELSIVKDYLDLEKVRFEERLNIHYELNTELNSIPFPPFILQTLVENAIKHGISFLINGGDIWIRTVERDDKFVIEIENTGFLAKPAKHISGIGIQNTIRRLDIQFEGRANFELKQTPNNTVISRIVINKTT